MSYIFPFSHHFPLKEHSVNTLLPSPKKRTFNHSLPFDCADRRGFTHLWPFLFLSSYPYQSILFITCIYLFRYSACFHIARQRWLGFVRLSRGVSQSSYLARLSPSQWHTTTVNAGQTLKNDAHLHIYVLNLHKCANESVVSCDMCFDVWFL